MQNLPTAEVYIQFFTHTPWKKTHDFIERTVSENVPRDGSVLDLMCGPGYLGQVLTRDYPKINYVGVDIDRGFLKYARKMCPNGEFHLKDVRQWKTSRKFDVVICSGGTHHLPYKDQEVLIARMAKLVKPAGMVMIADPHIASYSNEVERKRACVELGHYYLLETIRLGGSNKIIKATSDIVGNDVLGIECKIPVSLRRLIVKKYFRTVGEFRTWPVCGYDYGDYCFVARK